MIVMIAISAIPHIHFVLLNVSYFSYCCCFRKNNSYYFFFFFY